MRKEDLPWYLLLLGGLVFIMSSALFSLMYMPYPIVILPMVVHIVLLGIVVAVLIVPVTLDAEMGEC